jgi:hypothetical protein
MIREEKARLDKWKEGKKEGRGKGLNRKKTNIGEK